MFRFLSRKLLLLRRPGLPTLWKRMIQIEEELPNGGMERGKNKKYAKEKKLD